MKKGLIRIDPVDHYLYVYIGCEENFLDIIHEDFKDIGAINDSWDGFHAFLTTKKDELAHIIYLSKIDYGLMFHEIVHCVKTVMDMTDIQNEEFMAYTCQHLFNEIQKIK